MSPSFITPLRYPGGKARLGSWLSQVIESNGLYGCHYIEPYAGGAGAAMYLLINGYVDSITINDIDKGIYCFWWSIFNRCDDFIDLIKTTPIDIDEWYKQKIIATNNCMDNPLELGFSTFFMNRTNRSGIIKGGVIGGKYQSGKYKINARYKKEKLIERIVKLSSYKEKVQIYNMDAIKFIENLNSHQKESSLIYMDPPYYKKGNQLYRNYYSEEEHKEVSTVIQRKASRWIISYDNCAEIRELYKKVSSVEFSFHYSTHLKRPVGKESLFFSVINIPCAPFMKR